MAEKYKLEPLPPDIRLLETTPVLKKLASAHRFLAELKGAVLSIPNESILISTLGLQEAKDSSEVENIITTQRHKNLPPPSRHHTYFSSLPSPPHPSSLLSFLISVISVCAVFVRMIHCHPHLPHP